MADLVRLRPLREGDLLQLHRWYQDPALWDHLVGQPQRREAPEAIVYMRRWLTPTPFERRLAIEEAARGGQVLGLVTLSPIDVQAGEAEFHIFLGEPAARGRGYGRAATVAALAHAFDDLAIWRVRLRVLQTNAAALRVYAAVGFEPDPPTGETARKGDADVAVVTMHVTDAAFRERWASAYAGRSATR